MTHPFEPAPAPVSTSPVYADVTQPGPRRRTGLIATVATVVFLALVAGSVAIGLSMRPSNASSYAARSSSPSPSPSDLTVRGSLTLEGAKSWRKDMSGACMGTGGYDDITGWASVTVTDARGTVVGVGRLDDGEASGTDCVFTFVVGRVPAGRGFYGVSVTHRGVVQFAEDDLRTVRLRLASIAW